MKEGTPEQIERKHKMDQMAYNIVESSKQFYDLMKKINTKLFFIRDGLRKELQYSFCSSPKQEAICYCGENKNNLPYVKTTFIPNDIILLDIKKSQDKINYDFLIKCPENIIRDVVIGIEEAAYMIKTHQSWQYPRSSLALVPFSDKKIPWYKIKLYSNE